MTAVGGIKDDAPRAGSCDEGCSRASIGRNFIRAVQGHSPRQRPAIIQVQSAAELAGAIGADFSDQSKLVIVAGTGEGGSVMPVQGAAGKSPRLGKSDAAGNSAAVEIEQLDASCGWITHQIHCTAVQGESRAITGNRVCTSRGGVKSYQAAVICVTKAARHNVACAISVKNSAGGERAVCSCSRQSERKRAGDRGVAH